MLTIEEAAEIAGLQTNTVWEAIQRDELPIVRRGVDILIEEEAFEAWCNARKIERPKKTDTEEDATSKRPRGSPKKE